mmetsp:Transcript_3420/g.8782  ORF Transcript_3420/g.8782 Transcript_3420/m.8782 type:complete len:266 (+) Transcript_3420:27-824(+)
MVLTKEHDGRKIRREQDRYRRLSLAARREERKTDIIITHKGGVCVYCDDGGGEVGYGAEEKKKKRRQAYFLALGLVAAAFDLEVVAFLSPVAFFLSGVALSLDLEAFSSSFWAAFSALAASFSFLSVASAFSSFSSTSITSSSTEASPFLRRSLRLLSCFWSRLTMSRSTSWAVMDDSILLPRESNFSSSWLGTPFFFCLASSSSFLRMASIHSAPETWTFWSPGTSQTSGAMSEKNSALWEIMRTPPSKSLMAAERAPRESRSR